MPTSLPGSSTEFGVAKANKGNTNFVDTHIGQAMGRRAMIKWATVCDLNLVVSQMNIKPIDF
jgi:hypothetical protein